MKNSDLVPCKRHRFGNSPDSSVFPRKKHRPVIISTASIHVQPLGPPLVSTATGSSPEQIRLEPYRPYTIGRVRQRCDFVFEDRRVSKSHFQILFDALNRKICIADGVFWFCSSGCSRVKVSLNGVFVNGVRIGRGEVAELGAGDKVSLVCGNEGVCGLGVRIGFVVQRIAFVEEVFHEIVNNGASGVSSGYAISGSQFGGVCERVKLLLNQCRQVLHSSDPIWCIRKCVISRRVNSNLGLKLCNIVEFPVGDVLELRGGAPVEPLSVEDLHGDQTLENVNANMVHTVQSSSILCHKETTVVAEVTPTSECENVNCSNLLQTEDVGAPPANCAVNGKPKTLYSDSIVGKNNPWFYSGSNGKNWSGIISPPGNKFYLNRLQSMGHGSLDHHAVVSLPELLYPIGSLLQIFIATFTSDILWFLSCCEIPAHLPVTIACHNRERCWSSSPDQRISVPFSDFPNLVVVYPQFPEVVAFNNDRKKSGIACHHPKLLVLQREDSIRVVITSANLVAKQWNSVTNTVWWQDFPRTSRPDYSSLFTQLHDGDMNQDSKSDFVAQLAGFMASLVADVPSQAHWILELTKYDFKGAVGHLVASVPGIHSLRAASISEPVYFLPGKQRASGSQGVKVLGSVETSVVGLSHLFHTSADANGAQIKKLASFIGLCHENANGMREVVLKRNINIPADVNAVSILVPNPEEFSDGGMCLSA
ncbi:forkhead-associated domain-containing protein [Actinidia rufa]|uniref:Forkhead-associated domain-containing protein n=1 Tax=Actinidia rufa TaxID=165716 RepID=A0A7J0H2Q1_9ERIC|nr:forkhead-associated domain-containing protein [Actinidia rufa]